MESTSHDSASFALHEAIIVANGTAEDRERISQARSVESDTNEGKQDGLSPDGKSFARDLYLSWMAESSIRNMIRDYHRRHFGIGAFLFHFGAVFLALIVFHVIFR